MKLLDTARNGLSRLVTGLAPLLAAYHQRGLRTRFTLLFYAVTLLSSAIVGYFGYRNASSAHHGKALELVAGYTSETASRMDSLQDLVKNDLRFLATQPALLRMNYWHDMHDAENEARARGEMDGMLRQFLESFSYTYKVRFLDGDGHELINLRRNLQNGKVEIIAAEGLQAKSDSDYFQRSVTLGRGGYYASPLSPNTEHGIPEKPLVPVMRFATPVFGANDARYGVLVTSVLADAYFQLVREANAIDKNRVFFVIDANGNYLFHPDGSKMLGNAVGDNASFKADFPGLLDRVKGIETLHTVLSHGKIMSFRHIHPNDGRHENGFILVGMMDESVALAELHSFMLMFAVLMVAVALLVLLAARYFIGGIMAPLDAVTRQMQSLGRGETGGEMISYRNDDELGRMVASARILSQNMERLANQADVISRGDFSGEVPLLSERDRLGKAINNMTTMLRNARREDERSNWLKDGVNQLNRALTGELSAQELADTAISLVGRYLEAGRGVFYLFNRDEQYLELLGSYMFTEREMLGNRFRLGEGAIGQAARERKPIILHGPGDVAPIITGTSCERPLHTYTYPLLREQELLGAVEFASLERLDDLKLEFLARAAEVMASFLYIVEQRDRIKSLLKIAEEAAHTAQRQSEELQKANAQMEEQQQQLQQQTEELQASNAQMEEQQQQLRQQSEELQQTNAHLEEQQHQMAQQALELERKNSELNQSRDELDRRAQDLEQASRYKSEFLANMSHELRTPLNSIILLAKMLAQNEDRHLSDEEVKRAGIVHRAGEELLRLINDILDLSKIEAGRMDLHVQSIATADLAAEFQDLFAATAAEKGLAFEVEDRLQTTLASDHDKISQIVRNLLSNAFKFTREGRVCLRFEPSGRTDLPLRLAVADTGIGIPEDKQKLVFEAFHQADGSISRQYGGTGLGLTISLRFAELLGGTIELKSRHGEGSEFSLLLPRGIEERAASAGVAPSPSPQLSPVRPKSTPLMGAPQIQVHDDRANLKSSDPVILVVDDDPGFGEALMALNRRLGYKTLVATSGREGLRMAKTYRPRGVLLDLGLPDMDGSEVLHELKSDRELRHLPVYVVSARDKGIVSLQDSFAGYLQKPVSESELENAEASVLSWPGQSAILLLEGPGLGQERLTGIIQTGGVAITTVASPQMALEALATDHPALAVIDLTGRHDGSALCRALRAASPHLQLILYSATPLSPEDESALRPFTDSIIVKTAQADQRMLENIERFLNDMPAENPLSVAPSTAKSTMADDASPGGTAPKRLAGRRILVVDDDPRNLFVITSALEQQGASVATALSGRKGLEHLRKEKVDLVFMDIMMPDMDGYEATRAIRADPALKAVPVIALTAKALKTDREKALAAGADDYLSKPVDYEVLVNMAKVWCEEKT